MRLNKSFFVKPLLASTVIGITLLASCLNPVEMSDGKIKLGLDAKVSGEVDTTTRIVDNAVLWVINKTNSVDVTSLTIKRDDNPEGYVPHMVLTPPRHGSSVASYHMFSEKFYTLNIEWAATAPPHADFPTVSGDNKSSEIRMQMPRAQDYVIYVYRNKDGKIDTIQGSINANGQTVINNEIWGFDPDGNFVNVGTNVKIEVNQKDNTKPSGPTVKNVSPLVVRNVTKTADITDIKFGDIPFSNTGPLHGGQKMFKLEPGAYATKISFKGAPGVRGAPASPGTAEFKDVVIIDFTNNAQALHTLYLYFYRTSSGEYSLSPAWPPLLNNASKENSVEDTLNEKEGILQIINKSESATPLTGIKLNDVEMLSAGHMLLKDDSVTFVQPVGTTQVKLKPKGKSDYGFNINRSIEARKTTTLVYYDSLWAIDDIPPSQGYGSGLIKVINNSQGSVVSAAVMKKGAPTRKLVIATDSFRPDNPIGYDTTAFIPVVGTKDVPITKGASYLVQLDVETENDLITIERIANPLYNSVVTIILTDTNLSAGTARHGANITVTNQSSAKIVNVQVYNKDDPTTVAVFNERNFNPAGAIEPGASATFRINSTQSVPITEGARYKAYVSVSSNGFSRSIQKNFEPDGSLYDTNRTISITESDIPAELKFEPVTGITMTAGNNILHGVMPVTGGAWDFYDSPMILSNYVTVTPNNASIKGPIIWTRVGGDWDYADLSGDGKLSMKAGGDDVRNIAQGDTITKAVIVKATIKGAGANQADKSADITIMLSFSRGNATKPVTSFNLPKEPIYLDQGDTISLHKLISFNPSDANINGKPVSKSDLKWAPIDFAAVFDFNKTSDDMTVTAIETGFTGKQGVTIKVTLPADANGGKKIEGFFDLWANPVAMKTKTLRLIRTPWSGETIKAVVLRQISRSMANYSEMELRTGQTEVTWNLWEKRFTNLSKLMSVYPNGVTTPGVWPQVWREYACNLTQNGDYIDIELPANNTYFHLFVIKANGIIRGHCNAGLIDPQKVNDKFFVVDTDLADGNKIIDGRPYIVVRHQTYRNLMYY